MICKECGNNRFCTTWTCTRIEEFDEKGVTVDGNLESYDQRIEKEGYDCIKCGKHYEDKKLLEEARVEKNI